MPKNRTVNSQLSTTDQFSYTAPSQWGADINSILITNVNSETATFTLEFYNAVDDVYSFIMKDMVIPPHSMIQVTDVLWLQRNDKIRASASANNCVNLAIRVSEHNSL